MTQTHKTPCRFGHFLCGRIGSEDHGGQRFRAKVGTGPATLLRLPPPQADETFEPPKSTGLTTVTSCLAWLLGALGKDVFPTTPQGASVAGLCPSPSLHSHLKFHPPLDLFPHVLVPVPHVTCHSFCSPLFSSPLTPVVFQVSAEMSPPLRSLPGPHDSCSHGPQCFQGAH